SFCSTETQSKRFDDIFQSINDDSDKNWKNYQSTVFPILRGFVDDDLKIAYHTDHPMTKHYHKSRLKHGYTKKPTITLKELNALQVGDYVTHIDHGIGRFGGLQKIDVNGHMQEAIKLIYAENDIVYVSIHSLHKIAKYNGKDGTAP